jgi:hypothetical protein
MILKIGDKLIEVDSSKVIKATSKEIRHPDGRVDIEIHVPCLKIMPKSQGGQDGIGNL